MNDPNLLDKIRDSFSAQAGNFESDKMNFSKKDYLDYTVRAMSLRPTDEVLEVAAGTCACGRSVAPHVKAVTCLDATPAMLEVGQREAAREGLTNIRFVGGLAESLPFADGTFDVVLSRLAYHHFAEIETPFAEMARVLRVGGKLVVMDMEAAEESLRAREDELETLRDFSHVKNRSADEFRALYAKHGLELTTCESTKIAVSLSAWLDLTKTPERERTLITEAFRAELNGGDKTGFDLFLRDGEICFWQRWLLMIGERR